MVNTSKRWVGHRVSRNLACRMLGLTELGMEGDADTEGNRAIFRRRRSWLFRRTVPGRQVSISVGSAMLEAVCDHAGHFHVDGVVPESELLEPGGPTLGMPKTASVSSWLSEMDSSHGSWEELEPEPELQPQPELQTEPGPEPEPEPELQPEAGPVDRLSPDGGESGAVARASRVASPPRGQARASPNSPAVSVNVVGATDRRRGLFRRKPQSPKAFTPAQSDLLLVPPEGLSIISDIDDTVKVSNVLNKRELLANTFLREFTPIEGMAALFRRWGRAHGAVFHYVSASPWQLQPELQAFLQDAVRPTHPQVPSFRHRSVE